MAKNNKCAYIVLRDDRFYDCLSGVEALFDTAEAAKAYIQHRIDMYKRKHRRGWSGKWNTKAQLNAECEAEIRAGDGYWYTLYVEKFIMHSKDDIKELE